MTFTKTLTGTVLASAVAFSTLAAVPAHADDNDVVNFLAGAATGAVLLGALNNHHHDHYRRDYYVERDHYYRGHDYRHHESRHYLHHRSYDGTPTDYRGNHSYGHN